MVALGVFKEQMMEKTNNATEKETKEIAGLLNNVFSWTLQDVFNENLYKYKVV